MLPASQRLPRAAFMEYYNRGQKLHSPLFTLIVTQNKTPLQAAVVVSKKVAKSAVDRNRLRRRAYSVIERSLLSPRTGVYIVVYKKGALAKSRLALAAELQELLARSQKAR